MSATTVREVRATALDAVETQLQALWAEAAAGSSEPLLRASVVNLVVVVEGARVVPEVSQVIAGIVAEQPGRAIVLAPEPLATEPGVEAWLSLHCRASGAPGEAGAAADVSHVCCEQITVEARGDPAFELPAIVRPFLETDLPVVLWWRMPLPAGRSILDELAAEADVVIVDTARGAVWADGVTPGGDPLAAVSGLLARRPARPPGTAAGRGAGAARSPGRVVGAGRWTLRDLAFARLTPWRELTAALFDMLRCRRMLEEITSLSVAGRRSAPEVRLYLGWLASRLGWRATGPGSPLGRTYERSGGGRLTVAVAPVEERGPLLRVAFEGPEVRACLQLGETTPGGEMLEATAEVEGVPRVSRVVQLEPVTEVRLVSAELAMSGDDRVYEAALEAAVRP